MSDITNLANKWIESLRRSGGSSEATIRAREGDAARFCRWCTKQGVRAPRDVKEKHAHAFVDFLIASGYAHWTTTRYVSSIKRWFRWMQDRGDIKKSPFARVATRRAVAAEVSPRKSVDFGLVHLVEGDDAAARRDRALVAVLSDLGVSPMGVHGMTLADVRQRGGKTSVRFGAKWTELTRASSVLLKEYLLVRPSLIKTYHPALWISTARMNTGRPMSKRSPYRVLKNLEERRTTQGSE